MAVGFFVDPIFYKIGTGDFFNSFFSTIYIKIEDSDWGSRFPILMNDLYQGKIDKTDMKNAKQELTNLKTELGKLPPTEIVWDFEDLSVSPPWGNNISNNITNMANYFVTSDGENLLDILEKALNASLEIDEDVIVRSI
ncbi:MAG: Imm70 family immunity protein [Moheibacter sp.]